MKEREGSNAEFFSRQMTDRRIYSHIGGEGRGEGGGGGEKENIHRTKTSF